ncbi:response regulator [Paenibacillus filicis]|uniref:Response regulator n=1 Tax=Paenibacillus gyeongsangnamensis TaxID=3388067 RepID=A0ABT4Q1U9_9BACL|nr:response regulator [Paenibacillus filicis]MCZ8510858.1 response regulator [Paenibacillus filicis]
MKKILIVDDQTNICLLLSAVFSAEGYHTFQASSGKQALEFIRMVSPDILITDLKMPEMDGIQLINKVHALKPDVDIFLMSAYCELSVTTQVEGKGVKGFFPKPFDIDEVRMKINEHVLAQI